MTSYLRSPWMMVAVFAPIMAVIFFIGADATRATCSKVFFGG
jgi:hypothetical protein